MLVPTKESDAESIPALTGAEFERLRRLIKRETGIELRDLNYPGSTYPLAYDPTNDLLQGDYFQAALKQTFDVFFTRAQP